MSELANFILIKLLTAEMYFNQYLPQITFSIFVLLIVSTVCYLLWKGMP